MTTIVAGCQSILLSSRPERVSAQSRDPGHMQSGYRSRLIGGQVPGPCCKAGAPAAEDLCLSENTRIGPHGNLADADAETRTFRPHDMTIA